MSSPFKIEHVWQSIPAMANILNGAAMLGDVGKPAPALAKPEMRLASTRNYRKGTDLVFFWMRGFDARRKE
jgi:hypothetical protein